MIDGFKASAYTRDTKYIRRLNTTLDKYEQREEELREIIKKIIEKNASGVLEDGMYEEMIQEYKQERIAVENGITATRAELASDPKANAILFEKMLSIFTRMRLLKKDYLVLLDKIIVYEAEKMHMRTGRHQLIEIYWKHVGMIGEGVEVGEAVEVELM
ncbi:hypothetical protein FACS1894184_19970 [Clostridia bacterium]|nr:hypothetical protein FACS1894184_19970 [Clostridia bacterium]